MSAILSNIPKNYDENLLVGYDTNDDASIYKISEDLAIIQTLDFFPTMVKNPYHFGQIAAANALSDVYAMGGKVITAMNIVCYPEENGLEGLSEILRGGAEKVQEAGGVLAGGHTIKDQTAKYGLSVTGLIHPDQVKKNNTCHEGDALVLTKKVGTGVITSAYKKGIISEDAYLETVASMTLLNKYAAEAMAEFDVHSVTDVTGFGLVGHLEEMVGQEFTAIIQATDVPLLSEAYKAAEAGFITGGGKKNRKHMDGKFISYIQDENLEALLFDPQTSGGLLIALPQAQVDDFIQKLHDAKIPGAKIGMVDVYKDASVIIQ